MTVHIALHGADNIRVLRHYPANNNSITLGISGTEITVFGLPAKVTDKLMSSFSDEATDHCED